MVLGTNNRVNHKPTTSSITIKDGSESVPCLKVISQEINPIINVITKIIERINRDSGIKVHTKRAPQLPQVPGARGNLPK
tara:strand:+ start:94 stop:333 length:240 start_codon:yes stop_codon:yes gene_type:complete